MSAIIADATRAKDVVARTRSFVSNAPKTFAPLDLVVAAREANMLVERDLRSSGATVSLLAESDLPLACGDMVQIQQVFTNLLLNAAQAMAGKDCAKEITVSFRSDGQNIRVDVIDEGPGISATQLERVFDPFYTTRDGGIGMGLAICRNCIDAQGGNIWATSNHSGGATFHFTLPIHND
ncbi:ATP-binding protein [Sphingomonas sp. H160509]|uniref:sensor histidine kinase n=1 Tax=Sphingomonas sp. H160509 TaxID=2955313 RepID=UPI00209776D2|nr:ATP-binding protein [Sphingomonas sp. H160509]MDD1453285.1 ATP-binding protein [Sphingomonas sp. H160509]